MKKKELIDVVAEQMDKTKKEGAVAVEAVLMALFQTVEKGEKISLVGFGVFESVKRNERKCRNPQTGAEMLVPAKMAPKFKPSKAMKDAVAALTVD